MACLFDCFRAKHEQSTSDYMSQTSQVKLKRDYDSKNRLSVLFLSEESSLCHDGQGSGLDSMHIEKDIKDELQAQFLKASITIPATQIEVKKAYKNLDTPQVEKPCVPSQFQSWISSNSDPVFHFDKKKNVANEEMDTSEQTLSSCLTDAGNTKRISSASSDASEESIGTAFRHEVDKIEKVPFKAGNVIGKRKSVRSEYDSDQSYSSSPSNNSSSRKPEMAGKTNILETSPNPNSLKLSDEIQTAGTIFPANVDSFSSQIKHASLSKPPEDLNESLDQAKLQACKDKTGNESPTSTICEGNLEESSDEKYLIGKTRSSPWVKQCQENSNKNMEALSITPGDRPIIGMVAAHWKEKEQSLISPKWWDGNGIPNSTNKYKEDQKVSWHATPFEERLEKALSEEGGKGFIPLRKLGIVEESKKDTVISHLRHSGKSMSVISF